MKKLFTILLAIALMVSLVACGAQTGNGAGIDDTADTFSADVSIEMSDEVEITAEVEKDSTSGVAIIELVKSQEYAEYEITDPELITELQILYESFEYFVAYSSRVPVQPYFEVTFTYDGEEISYRADEYSVSAPNIKSGMPIYEINYYELIEDIIQKQTQSVFITEYVDGVAGDRVYLEEETYIEYLNTIYDSLAGVTDPTDEEFSGKFYKATIRNDGEEIEFCVDENNLIQFTSLGEGTFSVTDEIDYYTEMISLTIQNP
ncbi:MAG: hypothetical protein LUE20_05850 [Oscillospiraceae bacterium]|nr:hypothetical protein [Oscillospiraceae bacterium]